MKINYDLNEMLEEICEKVQHGKMEVINISFEPHIQPRYLTDSLEETERKDKLEYYEYNITLRQFKKDMENE